MEFTPDFRKVSSKENGLSFSSLAPSVKFPMYGDVPAVAIDFDGTLAEYTEGDDLDKPGKPVKNAIWALRTFKLNGWEVEIFTLRRDPEPVWAWVEKYANGLVDRVNESRQQLEGESRSQKPLVDMFIDDRGEYWLGKKIDWVEIMVRLYKRGGLSKGLLPLGKEGLKEKKDMIASFEEPIFREILSDLRSEVRGNSESREDLIRSVERYTKHLGLVGQTEDTLVRAKVAGNLLESVLRLLVLDRLHPVGCIILAQQDREIDIDEMPSLFESDF